MLENKIKEIIIDRLKLQVKADEILNDAPIFNTANVNEDSEEQEKGFDLDSIDALEVVVALNSNFQVRITESDMEIFKSINTIADYIKKNSPIAEKL